MSQQYTLNLGNTIAIITYNTTFIDDVNFRKWLALSRISTTQITEEEKNEKAKLEQITEVKRTVRVDHVKLIPTEHVELQNLYRTLTGKQLQDINEAIKYLREAVAINTLTMQECITDYYG